jgi:S-adenosylmethionine hydrolase
MAIITLMSDLGLKDGNVAVMKGIIWQIAPSAQIVDICHLIQPQNIQEAALIIYRAALYFPPNSIHVIVVDPGVGTSRRPIAAKIGTQYFICPDNGVLTLFLDDADNHSCVIESVHLDKSQFWLPEVSYVFHGRDIFAPIAAHLFNGLELSAIGSRINDLKRFKFPYAIRVGNGWQGEIIYIDNFGNIVTSILKPQAEMQNKIIIKLCGVEIHGFVNTFGEKLPGETITFFGCDNKLIIAIVNGNAARKISANIGDSVEMTFL